MMQKIVTLTLNPVVDKSTSVESVASEIKLRCEVPTFEAGGGGVNVSRVIHKLGGEAVTVLTLGGGNGQILRHLLQNEGLDLHAVATKSRTRENFIVFERATTLQYRFGMPGEYVTAEELQAVVDATFAVDADYIVASGSLPAGVPDEIYAQIAERASGTKARVIVDTSGRALDTLAGSHVYLLKPNINELEILSGEKFEGEEQMIRVTRRLIANGMAKVFVVSLGAQGAALITPDEYVAFRPPLVPIKSKVGAGDSMVGGLTLALARGWSLTEAVRYGIAAGTACVMTPGTELCRREDVEHIYPKVKILAD